MRKITTPILIGGIVISLIADLLILVNYVLTVVKLWGDTKWYNALLLWESESSGIFYGFGLYKISLIIILVGQLLFFIAHFIGGGILRNILVVPVTVLETITVYSIVLDMQDKSKVYETFTFLSKNNCYPIIVGAFILCALIRAFIFFTNDDFNIPYLIVAISTVFVVASRWIFTIGFLFLAIFIVLLVVGKIPTPGDIRHDLIEGMYNNRRK